MKSTKGRKTKKQISITKADLQGFSLDEMLTISYGPHGSAKRKSAKKEISHISKNIVKSNRIKETLERKQTKYITVNIETGKRNHSAYIEALPGCVATGKTLTDLKENIKSAVLFHLKHLGKDEIPIAFRDKEKFVYRFRKM